MPTNPLAGFDLGPTLAFYQPHEALLNSMINERLAAVDWDANLLALIDVPARLTGQITRDELVKLGGLYPRSALRRSHCRAVMNESPTWFHCDTTVAEPVPTEDVAEAICPTAIVPGYTGNARNAAGVLDCIIKLFRMPNNVPPEIARIVLAEAFVHEFCHTILTPTWMEEPGASPIRFPDGLICSGVDALCQFAELAEAVGPISHYSATYWRDGTIVRPEGDPEYVWQRPLQEEACETVAAYLLGFTHCATIAGREGLNFGPLNDRPAVRQWVEEFLAADLIA